MMHQKSSYRTNSDILQDGLNSENREENWCRCRTKLEKCLIFLVFFVVLTCVIIAAVLYLSMTTDMFEKKTIEMSKSEECETEHCLLTAAEFSHRLNKDAAPCTDFYSFACGRFTRIRSPLFDGIDNASYLTRIQEEMGKEEDEMDCTAVKVAKMYFKMCVKANESKEEEFVYLSDLIKDFGGWPLIEFLSWTSDDTINIYDKVLLQSKEKGFSTDYLLKLALKTDFRNTSKTIVYIEPPSNIIPSSILKEINSTYSEDQYKMALLLGSIDDDETREMLEELLHLEMEVAERSESYQALSPISIQNSLKILKLKELEEKIPSLNWTGHVKGILEMDEIDENTEVIITDLEYLNFFESILENKTQSYIMNFLMWKIVLESSFHLPSLFEEFQKLQYNILGLDDNMTRNEFCAKLVLRELPYMHNYFIRNRISIVSHFYESEEVIRFVKNSLVKYISSATWMDQDMKEIAINKLQNMTVHLGTDDVAIDKTYSFFVRSYAQTFFELSLYTKHYKNLVTIKSRNLKHFSEDVFNVDRTIDSFYSDEENLIYFTYEFLGNIFKANRPNYIHFSRVGFVSAYLIFQFIGLRGREYDADEVIRNWWTEEALTKLNESVNCHFKKKRSWKDQAGEIQWALYSVMEALNVAYKAYENWTAIYIAEKPLAGLHFTTQQLFWISYAQLMCSYHIVQEGNRGTSKWYLLKERERVNSPLKRLKIFSEDWNCQEKDRLHFKNTCKD